MKTMVKHHLNSFFCEAMYDIFQCESSSNVCVSDLENTDVVSCADCDCADVDEKHDDALNHLFNWLNFSIIVHHCMKNNKSFYLFTKYELYIHS